MQTTDIAKPIKCVFCDAVLLPGPAGSEEHVFLSSIGGRLKTVRAICASCNNAFSSVDTGEADQAVATFFEAPRNFLNILSGRKEPPPTIENIFDPVSGNHYDLAPGMTPVPRKLKLPDKASMVAGSEFNLIAGSKSEANRAAEILKLRKLEVEKFVASAASHRLGMVGYRLTLKKDAAYRSLAKTAIVAAVVLFGNEVVREKASADVRSAARYGTGDIRMFVSAALGPDRLVLSNVHPHPKSPDAVLSGFEHSVVFADVSGRWRAFLEFFGGFRFCVDLGEASGLPTRCLMINPRSATHARLEADMDVPPEVAEVFDVATQNDRLISAEFSAALNRVLETCYREGEHRNEQALLGELAVALDAAGDDDEARAQVMARHSQKVATIEAGGIWKEPIDITDA